MTFKVKTKGQNEGEKLLVPKLRFKEFNKSFLESKLNNIVSIYDGTHQTPNYTKSGIKFLSVENIKKLENSTKYISIDDFNKNFKVYPQKGDILMTRIGDIGTPNIVKSDEKFGFYVSLALLKNNSNIIMDYLLYIIQTISFQKELWKRTLHIAFPKKINKNEISEINIFYSSEKEEQEKIANFFSLLDKKIELQKQKIETLKIYKKGLMQRLFNLDHLEEKHVSDFGNILTGTTPSKLIVKYWKDGNIAWITPTDITESKYIYTSNEKLTIDGLNAGRFIPANSILITCIASIGKNAIIKVNGSCNQQINAIIPNDKFNSDYLYYLFELKKNYLQSIAGTSATSIINKSTFERLVFKVHNNMKMQNKIASILNCLELKFEIEKSKLEKLNFLKESLLQQMFI